MVKFISKSELDSKKSDKKKKHTVGEIYPQIFSHDRNIDFSKDIQLEAGIIWLGGYLLDSNLFPKETCPICGEKEALIAYKTVGSVLSGCHTINFYCKNCKERFVTNNYIEYFRKIKQYILENRDKFSPEQKLDNCTSASKNAKFIHNN